MRLSSKFAALAAAAVTALGTMHAYAAPDPVMGGGLLELVNGWELGDPRLTSHLALHVTSATGDPLVHVQLGAGATLAQVLPQLQAAGFRLSAASAIDPSRLEGYLPLQQARSAASIPGVKVLQAVQVPHKSAGSVQSQAVALEKANVAQAAGYDGTGVKIGALSDSYDTCAACTTHAASDIGSGDLPAAGVTVLSDLPRGSDEGRAMLQLIHDIAPASQLGFATAFKGELDFANNILLLRSKFHADVIVDDVVYLDEPMFSDGILAQAVDLVSKDGAAYFSSAGNNGLEAYEAIYAPIPLARAQAVVASGKSNVKLDQIPLNLRPKTIHVFGASGRDDDNLTITQRFSSATDNVISFQWDEPFYQGKVKTDFNIYVFDAKGNWMDPASPAFPGFYTTDDNTKTDAPVEFVELPPFPGEIHGGANVSDYQIVIGKVNDGPARHIKYVNVNGLGVSQFEGAPSIFGHATARGGQAVAAMYYAIPSFPEDFSSPGPATIYLDVNGNRLEEPQIRFVPQITAADGVDTTFFGFDSDGNGRPNFFGTSAAAPDAAAVGALVIQAAGGPGSIRPQSLYRTLQATATPVPLPNDRSHSDAQIGPLRFFARGDWTRWKNYFGFALDEDSRQSVTSIVLDLANTGLIWSSNRNRFNVGDTNGIVDADITRTVSADQKIMTLSFAPSVFHGGRFFRFGMSVFNPIQGSTEEDPDRFRGMKITAKLDSGSIYASSVVADPKVPVNRFTGAGLVDAAAATSKARDRNLNDED